MRSSTVSALGGLALLAAASVPSDAANQDNLYPVENMGKFIEMVDARATHEIVNTDLHGTTNGWWVNKAPLTFDGTKGYMTIFVLDYKDESGRIIQGENGLNPKLSLDKLGKEDIIRISIDLEDKTTYTILDNGLNGPSLNPPEPDREDFAQRNEQKMKGQDMQKLEQAIINSILDQYKTAPMPVLQGEKVGTDTYQLDNGILLMGDHYIDQKAGKKYSALYGSCDGKPDRGIPFLVIQRDLKSGAAEMYINLKPRDDIAEVVYTNPPRGKDVPVIPEINDYRIAQYVKCEKK